MEPYNETILSCCSNPKNRGVMPDADAQDSEENTTCGDEITVYLKLAGPKIESASYEGTGCAVTMAAAELLAGHIAGMEISEVNSLDGSLMVRLLHTEFGVDRMRCATLALRATKAALRRYVGKGGPGGPIGKQ
ncbi:MAG: iron-sulfur cluster assembly scaffold protein [Candidatus Micrarchaeota archaeon]|nr:iron-sulfur cluster assembly scaffold protein [Candidatus Micrarchaeota archaeon]